MSTTTTTSITNTTTTISVGMTDVPLFGPMPIPMAVGLCATGVLRSVFADGVLKFELVDSNKQTAVNSATSIISEAQRQADEILETAKKRADEEFEALRAARIHAIDLEVEAKRRENGLPPVVTPVVIVDPDKTTDTSTAEPTTTLEPAESEPSTPAPANKKKYKNAGEAASTENYIPASDEKDVDAKTAAAKNSNPDKSDRATLNQEKKFTRLKNPDAPKGEMLPGVPWPDNWCKMNCYDQALAVQEAAESAGVPAHQLPTNMQGLTLDQVVTDHLKPLVHTMRGYKLAPYQVISIINLLTGAGLANKLKEIGFSYAEDATYGYPRVHLGECQMSRWATPEQQSKYDMCFEVDLTKRGAMSNAATKRLKGKNRLVIFFSTVPVFVPQQNCWANNTEMQLGKFNPSTERAPK